MNKSEKKIKIIGVGMDGDKTITSEAKHAIEEADLLIGAERILRYFDYLEKPSVKSYDSREIVRHIDECECEKIAVLVSGDCGFYSAAGLLAPLLNDYGTELICGISTPVYLCSKLGLSWSDMRFVSLHGVDAPVVRSVCANRYTFFLLGGKVTPSELCNRLCEYGRGEVNVYIGENLASPNEKILYGKAYEFREYESSRLCALIVENDNYERHVPSCIADGEFNRGKVPMTKSEVRGICVAKLEINDSDICWDIGCGTGSVSIEMAFRCPKGRVISIDKNEEAISLTERNMKKFGCDNIELLSGCAEELLQAVPAPNCVFVGGSGGSAEKIITAAIQKNPDAKIIVTAVSLETLNSCMEIFSKLNSEIEISQIAVTHTRKIGSHTMLDSENPIFIISRKTDG